MERSQEIRSCKPSGRLRHDPLEPDSLRGEIRKRRAKRRGKRSTSFAGLIGGPIFSFVCRRGYSTEDAQDLTQDFFVKILESNWLQHADPNRGRFRSLLLTSLQNFLNNAAERIIRTNAAATWNLFPGTIGWRRRHRNYPSRPSARLIAAGAALRPSLGRDGSGTGASTPARGMRRQRRLRLFDALSRHLTEERDEMSYANLSAALGVAETAVKKQLHNHAAALPVAAAR